MKILNTKSIFLFGVLLLMAGEVFACRTSRDIKHSFVIDFTQAPVIRPYGDGTNSTILPQMVEKCTESAGKYLMLSKGVFMPTQVSDVADIFLDGDIPTPNLCRIENPIFAKGVDFDQKKSLVLRQQKFLKQCTFISVAELNGRPLRYKHEQERCKVTNQGASIVQLEGDYCFLNINPSYNLAVTLGVKPECLHIDTMKELGLEFGDIEAALNTYVTGDDTGLSTEVDPIGSSRYRYTFQAQESMLKLSEDMGPEAPRFPDTYNAELNMGDLQFAPAGDQRLDLNMYLSVDNFHNSVCKNGLCVNPSNYNIPVAAEVEIFKIEQSGKQTFVDGWSTGGIAQGSWQGLMRFPQQSIDGASFEKGQAYKVIVTMIDPFEDFYIFLNRAEQLLVDLKGVNGVAGLDTIPSLNSLHLLPHLPNLLGLPNITSNDINGDLATSLAFFKQLGATRLWPAFYGNLCDPSHGQCFQASKQKFWNRFTTTFTVGDLDDQGTYKLENIRLVKESPNKVIMDKKIKSLPRYTCEPF